MANPFRAAARMTVAPPRSTRRASSWAGADFGRLYSDWDAWTASPEFETRLNFRLLRARARTFARNNPWIVGFLDEAANNVVGAKGIMLQAMIRTALGKPAKATNDEIERGWKEWSYPENASADGHDSFIELERQIIQTVIVDGECFVRRLRGFPNRFGYALQIIDADLVDETYNVGAGPGQNRIRMGIEVDRYNRPIAYHVWTRYAEDADGTERKRDRIPAEDMHHLFVRWHRSNTVRGITWFAPVLVSMRHLGEYEVNHVVAARAAATKTAVIVNNHPDAVANFEPPKKGEEPRMFELEPGVMPELMPGQDIREIDPTFPTANYGDFVTAVLRAVARGLKVSYLTLTGDLRQANYSSMRAGLLPERDHWRSLQVWFATHFHRVTYRDWVDMAALKGAIAVDARLGSDYYDVAWRGRGWKWVDPKNDLEAAQIEIQLGVTSRQRIAAEQGNDYEEVIDEIEYEVEYADDHDVDVRIPSMVAPKALPAGPTDQADQKDKGTGSDETDSTDTDTAAGARRLAAVR